MPLETATYIPDLDPANPTVTDPIATLYEHIELGKQVLQNQFPNIGTVAVSATAAQLNAMATLASGGVLSAVANGTVASGELDLLGLMNAGGTIVAGRVELINVATSAAAGSLKISMTDTADASALTAATLTRAGAFAAVASVNAPSILKNSNELIPNGMIMLWSGTVASIPAGWALCDGTGGTPNLVGMFIAGAGTSPTPGTNGGSTTATGTAASAGAHTHSGASGTSGAHTHGDNTGAYALQVADMPAHSHTVSITDPGHYHSSPSGAYLTNSGPAVLAAGSSQALGATSLTTTATTGITASDSVVGSGGSHSHTIASDGNHTHTISSDGAHTHSVTVTAMPPYYALCYVMKVT